MSETKCQFDLLQRVTVPNGENIVGVVLSRIESADQPPMYSLGWTGLNGRSQGATFSEAEVGLFNPPPRMWVAAEPAKLHPEVAALAKKLRKVARKPARKSKSKRRK